MNKLRLVGSHSTLDQAFKAILNADLITNCQNLSGKKKKNRVLPVNTTLLPCNGNIKTGRNSLTIGGGVLKAKSMKARAVWSHPVWGSLATLFVCACPSGILVPRGPRDGTLLREKGESASNDGPVQKIKKRVGREGKNAGRVWRIVHQGSGL